MFFPGNDVLHRLFCIFYLTNNILKISPDVKNKSTKNEKGKITKTMTTEIQLEVCVDGVEGLRAALEGGADRIELCSALQPQGGLAPDPGLMTIAAEMMAETGVPVYAMVRPRAGNFVYTELELRQMELQIDAVRAAGLRGVVFGANLPDGRLDEVALRRLLARAKDHRLGVTLHRSFDMVPDLEEAFSLVSTLGGIERILTSGRVPKVVPDGLADIARLLELARGKEISIMPGSGLDPQTLPALFRAIPPGEGGIREVHASCAVSPPTQEMATINPKGVELGFELPEGRKETSAERVREMKQMLGLYGKWSNQSWTSQCWRQK